MDQLPWVKWHWIVVLGCRTVWILDGLKPADTVLGLVRRAGPMSDLPGGKS